MKRPPLLHLLIIIAGLVALALGAWYYTNASVPVEGIPTVKNTSPLLSDVPTTKSICEAAGGVWNECASSCPPGAQACVQVCVKKCEMLANDDAEAETVRLYFLNDKLDPEHTCTKVFPVERSLVRFPDDYPSMQALLSGPTEKERAAGYTTAIPTGVKFLNYEPQGKTTRFQFDARLDQGVAGSCRVGAIRAQIEATARAQGMAPAAGAIEIVAGDKKPGETLQP